MLVHRAERRINVQRTAADAQCSTQMVLNRRARVDGATYRRHKTSLSVLRRLADLRGDELGATERAHVTERHKWDRVADVGRGVTSSDAGPASRYCEVT